MKALPRPMPPMRRTQPAPAPQQDPYPQQAQWPPADEPQQPFMEEKPSPAPPPSPIMEQIDARNLAEFIEQSMKTALGLQVHLNHFQLRRLQLPADASAALADLFQDVADRFRSS